MEQAGSGVIGQCRNTQIPKHEGSSKFDASPDEGYAGLQREEGENPLSPPCIPPKFVLHGLSAITNRDARQAGAANKGYRTYSGNPIRNRDVREAGASLEGVSELC